MDLLHLDVAQFRVSQFICFWLFFYFWEKCLTLDLAICWAFRCLLLEQLLIIPPLGALLWRCCNWRLRWRVHIKLVQLDVLNTLGLSLGVACFNIMDDFSLVEPLHRCYVHRPVLLRWWVLLPEWPGLICVSVVHLVHSPWASIRKPFGYSLRLIFAPRPSWLAFIIDLMILRIARSQSIIIFEFPEAMHILLLNHLILDSSIVCIFYQSIHHLVSFHLLVVLLDQFHCFICHIHSIQLLFDWLHCLHFVSNVAHSV